jgi:SAM-dependent methyltransferase
MSSLDQTAGSRATLHASRRFPAGSGALAAVMGGLNADIRSEWAWDNYRATVEVLAREFSFTRLIEIGGGRDPLLTPAQAGALGFDYTINDISQVELDNAPAAFNKACFDVSGDLAAAGVEPGSYDLAFSRMVFEHVRDVRAAWGNLHTILTPGGVAFAFVPTLYALPYVANLMIPEWLSRKIVKLLYPHRTDHEDPKFPAYYDWCYSSEKKMAPMLREAGFRETLILPFYGHDYFENIPVAREIDEALTRLAIRFDWRALTPYAYIIARK